MSGPLNEWDLYARQFRTAIQNYRLKDDVEVVLVIPQNIDDPEILLELAQFTAIGVQLCQSELDTDAPLVAQVTFDDRLMTLISRSHEATIPGPNWHLNSQMVIRSHLQAPIALYKTELPSEDTGSKGLVNDIEIHKQLNGPVSQFGQRFWNLLTESQDDIQRLLTECRVTRIHYSDRYLQNPVALALLGGLLKTLKPMLTQEAEVTIDTLFRSKERPGNKPFHDWMSEADFQDFADQWFAASMGRAVEIQAFNSGRDIPHHRKLMVSFDNGQALKIRFDQGMGYWRINFARAWRNFNFNDDVSFQLGNMAQACAEGLVVNSEESWATDVLVQVIAP